ncbi:SDR family NAD(P)-dependent oxidoreductase [Streptomyces sp. ME19-01-6]|uniref:SDR family NAD(P)-dependent oxidoreductase n=1 Tax=Streptomyces sp. ME19-01-6 TaxID=3028686 RepID=UPI0029AD55B8|nr:SDR family NAD(P)-dependent oxidoreductase [Streptomyces sp. ME19-01-6]MDX3227956.1 SDR family NAD(P)-dependent oxidoreductase [Streptomyces sp. ME19-01-6]
MAEQTISEPRTRFSREEQSGDIAIIGLSCRLPGGITAPEELWAALATGRDLVGEVPEDRFDTRRFVAGDPRRPGKSYSAAGGFLDDITGFDAAFFGLSPREASRMDPQQRLLLEMAREALDDAGVDPGTLAGSESGVYVGVSNGNYGQLQYASPETVTAYTMAGSALCNTANRISHLFDLRGPSMAVDTACSSSLVALHQACAQLRAKEGPVTLACGINLLLNPGDFIGFSKASMLSPSGRCRSFSAHADGYVRAEGGAVVVLKRLADARADGDTVHAVVLGTGVGADGRTPGLSLPSAEAQEKLMRQVHRRAGVRPEDLSYVEAHGTGTQAGDPIECRALGDALGAGRRTPLPIGSVKSNLGHLESGAGIAGLLKCVLMLRHGAIPESLHAEPLNPAIDFSSLGLEPVTAPRALPPGALAINSFGFGGANAHAVLGPPPVPFTPAPPEAASLPVLVSAATTEALTEAVTRTAARLRDTDSFYHFAYTSCVRRGHHRERVAVLADSADQAATLLEAIAEGAPVPGGAAEQACPGPVAFVYSGNGAQWAGMGAELLDTEPAFRDAVTEVDAELAGRLGWSVLAALRSAEPELDRTEIAQPLLFAVQVGLTALLRERGIRPAAVAGHSVGEVAAAHACGALDLAAACRVIAERGLAQADTAGGGRMAAVGLPAAEGTALIAGRDLELAGVNSPSDVTLSGSADELSALGDELLRRGVFFRELNLDYAFHSRSMDSIRDRLHTALAGLTPRSETAAFVSAVTGETLPGTELDAGYWWRNIREPVLFGPAVATLVDEHHCGTIVEVGPHPVLLGYLRRQCATADRPVTTVCSLSRGAAGAAAVRTTCAAVLAAGAEVDWDAWFPVRGRVVPLPAYPWQREHHFNGAPHWWSAGSGAGEESGHPLLGDRLPSVEPAWRTPVEPSRLGWIGDHRISGSVVMPGASYLEMALAAGRATHEGAAEVTGLDISKALVLPWDDPHVNISVQTWLSGEVARVASRRGDEDWQEHAKGRVRRLHAGPPAPLDVPGIREAARTEISGERHYARMRQAELAYGAAFRGVQRLAVAGDTVLADYANPSGAQEFYAHPALVDSALQSIGALLPRAENGQVHQFLPAEFERVRFWRTPADRGVALVQARSLSLREAVMDITIADPDGTVAMELRGVRVRRNKGAASGVDRIVSTLQAAPLPGATGPTGLPAATALAAARADQVEALTAATRRYDSPTFVRRVTHLTGHFVAAALAGPEAKGARPSNRRLYEKLRALAEREGVLDRTPEPGRLVADLLRDFPAMAPELLLYARCGPQLAGVLTGDVDPMQLLFSDTERLAELHYTTSVAHQYLNRLARELVTGLVEAWPADRPLRILEVGAGTGSTTAWLLPRLPADRTTYAYTDISSAFFPRARNRFADYRFLDYRTLDLDRGPIEQDFTAASFDLVIAANVLHATTDVRRALRHLTELLDSGGRLLAVEFHDNDLFAPCYGLLSSATDFTDTDLREDTLLAREQWPGVLRSGGFTNVVQLGEEPTCSVLFADRGERDQLAPTPSGAAPGHFLVATDGIEGLPDSVVARLRTLGRSVSHVDASTDAARWGAALHGTEQSTGILVMLGEKAGGDANNSVDPVDQVVRQAAVLRAMVTACQTVPESREVRAWVLTCGEHTAVPEHPAPAAAWAQARTLTSENPLLRVRRIAVTPGATAADVCAELLAETDEDEVVLTAGGRFVPRITERRPATRAVRPFALAVADDGPAWTAVTVPEPGPGEVLVEVRAAALNYADVMVSRGLVPPMAETPDAGTPLLGLECAGVVTRVGADVTDRTVGERVMVAHSGSLTSHLRCQARLTIPISEGMSFTEAATLPTVFATVHYSLDYLARLRPGETVLVHGAAGGVGLAALRYAEHVGATVVATAGSPAKRQLLRLLGHRHVLDSRSLGFADEVREITAGRGVDVVLNSVAGEALGRGMELLRPHGRFVELGKRDILADNALALRSFSRDLSFFGVDLTSLLQGDSPVAEQMVAELTERVGSGVYRPLPHVAYPANQIAEAVALLRDSRHIGKIVIIFDPTEPVPVRVPRPAVALNPEATYLVAGGLGGFGAATALWLARCGARHLALASRSGAAHPEARAVLDRIAEEGATATAYATDITDPVATRDLVDAIEATGHPLRGVINAAMVLDDVLDDATAVELDDERTRAVVSPKLAGTAHLDRLTRDLPLDFFVFYSSISALAGNLRQSTYAAGNLAGEAVIRQRRAAGLPGLAVQWCAISDTGYADRAGMVETMRQAGFGELDSVTATRVLGELITDPDVDVIMVGNTDWAQTAKLLPTVAAPRFAEVLPAQDADPHDADGHVPELVRSVAEPEALGIVTDVLVSALATVLQTTSERIDPNTRLDQLGLESLMAAELSSVLQRRLDCIVPTMELATAASVRQLAPRILGRIRRGA